MAAIRQVQPLSLFTEAEWRALTARPQWVGVALVLHCWATIAAAVALVALWPDPWTLPLVWAAAVMVVGARQLGLAILMHEAAHGLLHRTTRLNAVLGQYLCAAPVGADLTSYRPYHLQHHRFTQQEEDPDLGLSRPFPTSRASLRRKIVRDLTGQTFFKQRIGPFLQRGPGGNVFVSEATPALRRFIAAQAILFLLFALAGVPWLFLTVWVGAMATWFPLVTRLRNIAEHACTERQNDCWRIARTTRAAWWERALIAPYWVNYHSEHHLFFAVPCFRLPALHRALAARGLTERMILAPSYVSVMREAAPA